MSHHDPLFRVNDDFLREVVDYLHGSDALSVSLTSKHVYELAVHRISAVIECKCREKLRLLHRTMVHENPWRAKHIQKLVIQESSAPREPPVAPLVVDLLRVAPNICSLTIHRFDTLRPNSDPGVLKMLGAQAQLSQLELSGVRSKHLLAEDNQDTGMPPFLQASWCHLAKLSLDFSWPFDDDYLLLDIVAAFPRLHTLRLIGFRPWDSFLAPKYARSTTPLFPSIRKLLLENATPSSLDLVGLCPNVSLVGIGIRDLIWDITDDDEFPSPAVGPRWNPLRSIILSSEEGMDDAQAVLGSAFHLQIVHPVTCTDRVHYCGSQDALDVTKLLKIVGKVSPIRIQVPVVVGGEPMCFWERVAELALSLRFLELKITLRELEAQDEDISWLVKLI
ncbi:hypothetical protein V8D89_007086 [Ganoderma adspersum]